MKDQRLTKLLTSKAHKEDGDEVEEGTETGYKLLTSEAHKEDGDEVDGRPKVDPLQVIVLPVRSPP
jgi:hypothetical protein